VELVKTGILYFNLESKINPNPDVMNKNNKEDIISSSINKIQRIKNNLQEVYLIDSKFKLA
jgi:hypothetical protein